MYFGMHVQCQSKVSSKNKENVCPQSATHTAEDKPQENSDQCATGRKSDDFSHKHYVGSCRPPHTTSYDSTAGVDKRCSATHVPTTTQRKTVHCNGKSEKCIRRTSLTSSSIYAKSQLKRKNGKTIRCSLYRLWKIRRAYRTWKLKQVS